MRKPLMTWEAAKQRWRKMHQGTLYTVSCHALGTAPTKEESYQAANVWWTAKLQELAPTKKPVAIVAEALGSSSADDLAHQAEQGKLAERLLDLVRQLTSNQAQLVNGQLTVPINREAEGLERLRNGQVSNELLDQLLTGRQRSLPLTEDRRQQEAERFAKKIASSDTPKISNLVQHGQDFLAIIRPNLRPKSFREVQEIIDELGTLADERGRIVPDDVSQIDETTLKRAFLFYQSATLSVGKKKKRFQVLKRLVDHLAEMGIIRLPGNFSSRLFRFRDTPKAIKVYSVEQVREALGGLKSRLRLYAMLALNCGMNNVDMGQLRHDQIKGEYLTRKRVKTSDDANVPTVTYKLWPETLALLAEHTSKHETLVLTSMENTPLWSAVIKNGRCSEKDLIGMQWQRAKKDGSIPLKAFRSIASTLLGDCDGVDGNTVTYFLGQSPQSVKDRHYQAPSQRKFDLAVECLRAKIFGEH